MEVLETSLVEHAGETGCLSPEHLQLTHLDAQASSELLGNSTRTTLVAIVLVHEVDKLDVIAFVGDPDLLAGEHRTQVHILITDPTRRLHDGSPVTKGNKRPAAGATDQHDPNARPKRRTMAPNHGDRHIEHRSGCHITAPIHARSPNGMDTANNIVRRGKNVGPTSNSQPWTSQKSICGSCPLL